MLLHHVSDLVHLLWSIEASGGVVRVADEYSLGLLVDEFFEFLHCRQCESVFNLSGYRAHLDSCRDGEAEIVGIERFGENYLVARVETSHECYLHRLASAAGYHDVVRLHVDVVFPVVSGELLSVAQIALRSGIFQERPVDVFQSVESHLRCRQVWLSDIEVIHLRSSFFRCGSQWNQLADWRFRHLLSAH